MASKKDCNLKANHVSNADKIRNMTNEELANFMYFQCCSTKDGVNYIKIGNPCIRIKDTKKGWLEWLESECAD